MITKSDPFSQIAVESLTKSKVLIVIPVDIDDPYLRFLGRLIIQVLQYDSEIEIVIMKNVSSSSRKIVFQFFLKKYKLKRIEILQSHFSNLDYNKVTFSFSNNCNFQHSFLFCKNLSDLKGPLISSQTLYNSVRSVLATNFTFTAKSDYRIFGYWRKINGLINDYKCAYRITSEKLQASPIDTVIFFNGRAPSQAAIREAADERNIKILALETGAPHCLRWHLNNFQVQEIEKLQAMFLESRANFSKNDSTYAVDFADKWLTSQSEDKSVNRFLKTRISKVDFKINHLARLKLATLFTSCTEEEIYNLGENKNGWDSQIDAIVKSANYLKSLEYEVVVRIHPNASNKAFVDLFQMVSKLNNSGIRYYLPWDTISSYELLDSSSLVGTWESTIGLESAARGIPTFVLGLSRYTRAAGICSVNPTELSLLRDIKNFSTDIQAAKMTIFQLMNFGTGFNFHENNPEVRAFDESLILLSRKYYRWILMSRALRKILRIVTNFNFLRRGRFITITDLSGPLILIFGRRVTFNLFTKVFRYNFTK